MRKDPKALYQEVIMRHNREPVNYEKAETAAIVLEAYNPLCGDQFKLFLDIEEGRVVKARFFGYGCAISKASTSILIQRIEGLSVEEVRELTRRFEEVVSNDGPKGKETDPELSAFAAARQFPGRLQCATLSWEALTAFLDGKKRGELKVDG